MPDADMPDADMPDADMPDADMPDAGRLALANWIDENDRRAGAMLLRQALRREVGPRVRQPAPPRPVRKTQSARRNAYAQRTVHRTPLERSTPAATGQHPADQSPSLPPSAPEAPHRHARPAQRNLPAATPTP
jgi:hypothetical protein